MMSTRTAHCQWEDRTVRERTGHPSSYAEAKKMKLLILQTHGCPRASLRDWSYSSSSSISSSRRRCSSSSSCCCCCSSNRIRNLQTSKALSESQAQGTILRRIREVGQRVCEARSALQSKSEEIDYRWECFKMPRVSKMPNTLKTYSKFQICGFVVSLHVVTSWEPHCAVTFQNSTYFRD